MGKGTAAIKAGGDIISAGLQMGGQIAMAEAMKYQADSDRNVARTRYLADRTTATADLKRVREDRIANWETLEGKREEDAAYAQEERDKAAYENKLFLRDLIYKEYLEERKRERELEDIQHEQRLKQQEELQRQQEEERKEQEAQQAFRLYQKYGHMFGDIGKAFGMKGFGGAPPSPKYREPYDDYSSFSSSRPPRMRGYDSEPDRSYHQSSNYDPPVRYEPPKDPYTVKRQYRPYPRRELEEVRQDNLEEAAIQRQKFMNLEKYGSVIPAAVYRAQNPQPPVNKRKTKVGGPVRTQRL